MSVTAKFKVQRIEAHTQLMQNRETGTYGETEVRTVVLMPVYSEDPESENRRFWNATPSGEIRLGTVNPEAWQHFALGDEFYVDFTKAEKALGASD